jgi:hypothetical protein
MTIDLAKLRDWAKRQTWAWFSCHEISDDEADVLNAVPELLRMLDEKEVELRRYREDEYHGALEQTGSPHVTLTQEEYDRMNHAIESWKKEEQSWHESDAKKDKRIAELEGHKPFVTFIEGGGLQLEWTIGDRHLEIEFGDAVWLTEERGESVDGLGDTKYREFGELTDEGACAKLRSLLDWVLGVEATDGDAT